MMEEARIQYSGFVGDVVALAQSYALEIRKMGASNSEGRFIIFRSA